MNLRRNKNKKRSNLNATNLTKINKETTMINNKPNTKQAKKNKAIINHKKYLLSTTALHTSLSKTLVCGTIAVSLGMLMPEIALAEFSLDKAGKALTDPIKMFIDTYWPVGVLALGTGGAVVAQGDLRAKALGFGAGSLLAGLVMGGVKMGLGV